MRIKKGEEDWGISNEEDGGLSIRINKDEEDSGNINENK